MLVFHKWVQKFKSLAKRLPKYAGIIVILVGLAFTFVAIVGIILFFVKFN